MESDIITGILEEFFDDLLIYVKQNLFPKMDVLECNITQQVITMISIIGLLFHRHVFAIRCRAMMQQQ